MNRHKSLHPFKPTALVAAVPPLAMPGAVLMRRTIAFELDSNFMPRLVYRPPRFVQVLAYITAT